MLKLSDFPRWSSIPLTYLLTFRSIYKIIILSAYKIMMPWSTTILISRSCHIFLSHFDLINYCLMGTTCKLNQCYTIRDNVSVMMGWCVALSGSNYLHALSGF